MILRHSRNDFARRVATGWSSSSPRRPVLEQGPPRTDFFSGTDGPKRTAPTFSKPIPRLGRLIWRHASRRIGRMLDHPPPVPAAPATPARTQPAAMGRGPCRHAKPRPQPGHRLRPNRNASPRLHPRNMVWQPRPAADRSPPISAVFGPGCDRETIDRRAPVAVFDRVAGGKKKKKKIRFFRHLPAPCGAKSPQPPQPGDPAPTKQMISTGGRRRTPPSPPAPAPIALPQIRIILPPCSRPCRRPYASRSADSRISSATMLPGLDELPAA